jgi:hypothetical protein
MGEWQDRQVGIGALCSVVTWITGLGLIGASIAGVLDHPWANLGTVLFMVGCLRTVLAVIEAQERRVRDAFELGRESASLKLMRD